MRTDINGMPMILLSVIYLLTQGDPNAVTTRRMISRYLGHRGSWSTDKVSALLYLIEQGYLDEFPGFVYTYSLTPQGVDFLEHRFEMAS